MKKILLIIVSCTSLAYGQQGLEKMIRNGDYTSLKD